MQVGGASAKSVVRAEEPSSAGHGVGPEICAPAAGGSTLTVGPGGSVVGPSPNPVVVVVDGWVDASPPLSLAAATIVPTTAISTTTTATMAMSRRRRSVRSTARRAAASRPAWRSRLRGLDRFAMTAHAIGPRYRCRDAPEPSITCPPVALVVQKFGGTSVADPDRMRAVADHV